MSCKYLQGLAERNCRNMQKKNLIRFLEALVLLPVITASTQFGSLQERPLLSGINNAPSQIILSQKLNMGENGLAVYNPVADPSADLKAQRLQMEGEAIDAYFRVHGMPLQGLGMKMAREADTNGIDWRLLPAIAVRESTGGKNTCDYVKHNPFGWGSCKIGFKSNEEAIETVARNLGGNNPNTATRYENKTTEQILRAYNPPSIVPHYVEQVITIMNAIGEKTIIPDTPTSSSGPSAQIG